MDDLFLTMKRFVGLFRQGSTLPWTILLPLLVVALAWGLRLALRSDGTIRKMRSLISNRSTVLMALTFGPGVIALLIWINEPVWCQRFLSVYFLVMAGLYLLDVIDGRHAMVQYFLPAERNRGADGLLTRVMAIYQMALLLLNETMIAQTSLTVWLVYFGLLPVLSHRILLALVRTVDEAYAAGYGRL
jgi:hypothetical protein